MNRVFADSFYFFALLNPKDTAHRIALEFSQQNQGPIVTTAWVLTELATSSGPSPTASPSSSCRSGSSAGR